MDDSDFSASSTWLRRELVAKWAEIFAVILLTSGVFIGSSTWNAVHGSSRHYLSILLNDQRLLHNLVLESAILGLLLLFLRRRGWTPIDLKIFPSWVGTLQSIPLMIAMMVGNTVTVVVLYTAAFLAQSEYKTILPFITANAPHFAPHSIQVGWIVAAVTMLVNAFFEEICCMAYMFNQFAAKRGPLFALLLTVLVRMACHTYEGPIHMLGIGVVFLIVGAYYWWSRNLWPVILAHASIDFISVVVLKLIHG